MFGSQSLQILLAGKSEIPSRDDNMLTRAKDRGDLWAVTTEVFQIFQYVESYFRRSTTVVSKTIDIRKMLSDLLKNPSIYVTTMFYVIRLRSWLANEWQSTCWNTSLCYIFVCAFFH